METSIIGTNISAKRLKNVDAYLQRLVDSGQAAGVGALINRNGVTAYRKSFGLRDVEKRLPAQDDTIYRIYSMSKTFTIVAAMTLYEKGLFKLHDPISEFLPAFKEMVVARHDSRGCVSFVPADKPISFEHLFTMTAGIPYTGNESYTTRFLADIWSKSAADAAKGAPWKTARVIDAVATAPLCFHPGEFWMYGLCHDVLGRLIEVISGKPFGVYLDETICQPLGLSDTAFFVAPEKQARLAKGYSITASGLVEIKTTSTDPGQPAAPAFESGGGGLTSTMDDVSRYALMLLNNGKLDDERIVSRKTIDLIRHNHVTTAQRSSFGFSSMAGYGYGLGVRTLLDKNVAGLNGSVGEWAWDGMLGTWYCVDPDEDLVAVFMVQRQPGNNEDLPKRFAQTVYAAIDD